MPAAQTSARAGRSLVVAIALVPILLVLALRLPHLGMPLGVDEGGMTTIGAGWIRSMVDGTEGAGLYGDHWIDRPPLLLLLYGGAHLLGDQVGVRLLGIGATIAAALCAGYLARAYAGDRAWLPAACIAGTLLSMPALDGHRTPGELLAAVPAAASLAVLAHLTLRPPRPRRLLAFAAAGALAASAVLVKQSALDAGFAAAALFAWRATSPAGRQHLPREFAAYAAGTIAAIAAVLGAAVASGAPLHRLAYALVGFRLDVLRALEQSHLSPAERATRLLEPAVGSGLLLIIPVAAIGIAASRRGGAARGGGAVLLAAWCAGALLGIAGGGYFWNHYLLQLVVPVAVGAGIAVSRAPTRWAVALVAPLVLLGSAQQGYVLKPVPLPVEHTASRISQEQRSVIVIADFIRRNSSPGDPIAVLYARANLPYHAGRPAATQFSWSSMYRALPQARTELLQALRGPDRAAWVVAWQRPTSFGMDEDGQVRQALADGYRDAAVLCGKPLLVRSDRELPQPWLTRNDCMRGPDGVVFTPTSRRSPKA